ncbi:MAG: insulinase family protein [Gammaproteobacteria bacterium]|nr:insulinase family protein [Gammaproteobacteria bacterium]MBA3731549.1 insulinase family protein [Gammaproteobacteria bacterium]
MRLMVYSRGLLAAALLALAPWPAQAGVNIQHWTTGNGMRVYFTPAPELPIIDMRVVLDAGSARDGEQPGVAGMTATLLNEGSDELDADAIAVRFEEVGAEYAGDAGLDQASVSLRSLSDANLFEPAFDTFMRALTNPSFPPDAVERIRNQILVGLREEAQSPDAIASRAFYRAVYGTHPFASAVSGTERSVRGLERKDVQAFHERYYVAGNGVLALTGDLTRAQAERLAERIDQRMPKGKPPAPLPEVQPLAEARTVKIPFPSEQAHVYIGQPGIARGDPDYFPLYVGNHILGGSGFTSRLMKEVRVERGLSYSVYSYFLPELVAGPFMIGLQTRIDQATQAARVARDTVRKFVREGPTAQELTLATSNITAGFPLRIDSNADILEYLALIGYYKLPLDYLDTFNHNVEAVDQARIRAAFSKQLNIERMVKVIVGGDAKG